MKTLTAALRWVFAAVLVVVGVALYNDFMKTDDLPPAIEEIFAPPQPGDPQPYWDATPDYESTSAGRPDVSDPRFQNNGADAYAGPSQGRPTR